MARPSTKVLLTVLAILLIGGTVFVLNYQWISSTYQKVNIEFSKFAERLAEKFDESFILLERLAEVKGVKEIHITVDPKDDSDNKTSCIEVAVDLEKGYRIDDVANELVGIMFEYYPESKNKDKINVVRQRQFDLDFFYYSLKTNEISRSPAEWEEVINK